MTTKRSRLDRISEFEQANHRCAAIIAADPVRYQGIMQEIAQIHLKKAQQEEEQWELTA